MSGPQVNERDDFLKFQEILFWPLEIASPAPASPNGATPTSATQSPLELLKAELAKSDFWDKNVVDPLERGTAEDDQTPYQEFVYFHTFAQRFLYGGDELQIYRRKSVGRVAIELDMGSGNPSVTETLDVDRVHLYLFRTQIAVLVVEVSSKRRISRDSVLQLEDQFRRVYPPFFFAKGKEGEQTFGGGHCPVRVQWQSAEGVDVGSPSNYEDRAGLTKAVLRPKPSAHSAAALPPRRPPVAAHWLWLLSPLTFDSAKPVWLAQIEDDRMPAMVYLQHPHPAAISEGDRIRHCFFDGAGNPAAWPYGRDFLANFEKDHAYTRFWDPEAGWKTLYTSCSSGFTVLTSSGYYGEVLREHFRHHYFQIGLLAQFHRASLLRFSRRFNEAMKDEGKIERGMRDVRREFAGFISTSWFHEVSNQEQGRELFEFWSRQLGTDRLMEKIMAEVSEVDEVLEAEHEAEEAKYQSRLSVSVERFTKLLYAVAAMTLGVAFLDMEMTRETIKAGQCDAPWFMPWTVFWLVAIVGLAWAFYAFVTRRTNRSGSRKSSGPSDSEGNS